MLKIKNDILLSDISALEERILRIDKLIELAKLRQIGYLAKIKEYKLRIEGKDEKEIRKLT